MSWMDLLKACILAVSIQLGAVMAVFLLMLADRLITYWYNRE